jgi:hypothetical protein
VKLRSFADASIACVYWTRRSPGERGWPRH